MPWSPAANQAYPNSTKSESYTFSSSLSSELSSLLESELSIWANLIYSWPTCFGSMAVTYSNDNKPKKQATIKEEKVFIFYNKL